jgi:hypothetical protein
MSEQPFQPSVFLSYTARDKAAAEAVANVVRQSGVEVRTTAGMPGGASIGDSITKAMRESDAYVLVTTPETANSPWFAFELGAAMAWGKPIFVVATERGPLPGYLQNSQILSVTELDRLVRAVRTAGEPLSDTERDILEDIYAEIGVPSEKLMLDPDAAARLAQQFNLRARSTSGSARLIRELTRLRKSGHLPRLGRAGRAG